jgi:diacylglycerol kinase family enzyme
MIRKYQNRKTRPPRHQPLFIIVVNNESSKFNKKAVSELGEKIRKTGARHQIFEPHSPRDTVFQIRRILNSRPEGIIACGGDTTVNLIAQTLVRHSTSLGILPMGRFNNIYRSLYGEPNLDQAMNYILSKGNRKIDHGLVAGRFFLGSVGIGLIPELAEAMKTKGVPHFGIGWSRLTAQAASRIPVTNLTIKIESFKFELSPLMVNINLLPYSGGLPLTPGSIDDDGKGEVIFDFIPGKAIFSNFIRQISKKKYIYSDEIRMFRGSKISISPVPGNKFYLDGELVEHHSADLNIEIFEKKVRIFGRADEK